MSRTRIKLAVYIDLDPVPGAMHSAESAQNYVRFSLTQMLPAYNPMVSIESYDTSQQHGVQPLNVRRPGAIYPDYMPKPYPGRVTAEMVQSPPALRWPTHQDCPIIFGSHLWEKSPNKWLCRRCGKIRRAKKRNR